DRAHPTVNPPAGVMTLKVPVVIVTAGAVMLTLPGVRAIVTAPAPAMMLTLPGVSPPASIGTSQIEMPAVALSIVTAGVSMRTGLLTLGAMIGMSPSPQQLPTQMGLSGSPRSSAIQTLAPILG